MATTLTPAADRVADPFSLTILGGKTVSLDAGGTEAPACSEASK